ncbi:Pre-mRNA-processing ATP-dependent RNA helicase PRP5 [Colletotrichum chlorophyti]|uniref:RNA helicase n=1 Tax=Colletotrichum chlorophyti TaxID=708187 RepID=A0A1Q8RWE1_9PEZI|nr:Pre-mRNA-processing ATP-dependent RNA helicase PRP5 [Colletotrichum chlorophyti]
MARTRDSRSPSPAGSQYNAKRHRKDDERRDRDRRDDGRDYRRRSRSRSPADVRGHHHHRKRDGELYSDRKIEQRRYRDRERDRDAYRRRDRSLDRRDDDSYRGGRRDNDRHRDRRRSRDRYGDRDRSLDRRRHRDSDRDHRARRDDSRDRGAARRDGTADSRPRSRRDDSRSRGTAPPENTATSGNEAAKPKPTQAQTEADKKAERLARLEAWKKSRENKAAKENEVNPSQTRNLLAEMDKKSAPSPAAASPAVASPAIASPSVVSRASASPAPTQPGSGAASPAVPYAGKFDPKAIAKKATLSNKNTVTNGVLGVLDGRLEKPIAPVAQITKASALPANRGNLSAFGFHKSTADSDKLASKRKLDLDEEEGTKRKLTKLPTLPLEADDTPYADQDEDDESDGGEFAETEEEAIAAARAAHERRGRELQEAQEEAKPDVDMEDAAPSQPNGVTDESTAEKMDVEDEEDVDPLDAFMADLQDNKPKPVPEASTSSKTAQEPEAYFSDDDYAFKAEDNDANAVLAIAAKRKKKDIPTIDYSKLDLPPVRKNFWVEPAELAAMTEEEKNELRTELDGIKVSGKAPIPAPVKTWSRCGLSRPVLDVIADLGYETPTPIQMQALPVIMSGRDVVGVAKTGSGKTMAFVMPLFRQIMDQPPLKDTDGPIGLIMTPTRELAVQIHRDCKPFLKPLGLRAVCAYGGAPIRDQIADLKRGAEIVVCTPGRMIDLLAANQGRVTNLRRVTYVVLDEADRMFDMGFEPQVMKIFANMRPDRQTILFSATMPRIIDSLTKKVLKSPVEITVGGRSVVAPEITQIVEVVNEEAKFVRLLGLLGELYDADEDARTIIFVERQEKADELLKNLLVKGYPCNSIHGGKDQVDRDSTISDFKKGIVPVLIATSVAARGLDVKQLKLVVNYDAPTHPEDMVHRNGRTGRAGNKGTAVTFITEEQENCAHVAAKVLEQSGQPVPERVDEMRKAWKEKVKSGKAKDNSGFGGKGLDRLDAEREAARLRERKTHKAEGEEEDTKEEKTEEDKGRSAASVIKSAVSAIVSRDASKPEADARTKDAPAARGAAGGKQPLDAVSAAIRNINERLGKAGQLRSGQPIDNKGPDAGAYHATLEINDFPQKARWAVTNRTNVAKILEATGVSITTKGTFYPAGKEVPPGADPKLYILVEGDTEVVVGAAMTELTRLLSEGAVAAATADSRAPASGRYNVV